MKGYVVCVYKSISNEEKLKEYAVKARAAVEKYKGKFLIRGGRSTSNEGDKSPRTVVIEFPSYDEANNFINQKNIKTPTLFSKATQTVNTRQLKVLNTELQLCRYSSTRTL